MAKLTKKQKKLAETVDINKLYGVNDAIETLKTSPSPPAPARTCASPSSPAAARPMRPARPVPMSSAPRI